MSSRKVFLVLCVVAVLIILFLGYFGTTAFGDSMRQFVNLGDIQYGYFTDVEEIPPSGIGTYSQLYAFLSGDHKINISSVRFGPCEDSIGYKIDVEIYGQILPLKSSDITDIFQSNSLGARGISLSEYSRLNVSKNDGINLTAYTSDEISIMDFKPILAEGSYSEFTQPWLFDGTDFSYKVTWYGNFLPGKGPTGIFSGMTTSVPEPSSIVMFVISAIAGLMTWRKYC